MVIARKEKINKSLRCSKKSIFLFLSIRVEFFVYLKVCDKRKSLSIPTKEIKIRATAYIKNEKIKREENRNLSIAYI